MTRTERACVSDGPPDDRAPALSESPKSVREAFHAGTRPNRPAASRESASVNASVPRSSPASSSLGMFGGANTMSRCRPADARARPRAPAITPRTALSVKSLRDKRPRPAPKTARTAISCSRPVPRANTRFATLLHEINSTKETEQKRTISASRVFPLIITRNGVSVIPGIRLLPKSGSLRLKMVFVSVCAWAIVTCGDKRPIACHRS